MLIFFLAVVAFGLLTGGIKGLFSVKLLRNKTYCEECFRNTFNPSLV